MKRINNLYNEILDIKKIIDIYNNGVKKNTKNKYKLERFENNYISNMYYILNVLKNMEYIPFKYNIFLITQPKTRLIMSQNIIDKIINQLVAKYFLVDVYDKTLIDNNIATRNNKGTHLGLRLFKKYLNSVRNEKFYVLKFDINKYFFNLDHEILKKIIRKKIKDKNVLNILDCIIDSTDNEYINKNIVEIKSKEIERIEKLKISHKEKLLKINNIKKIPIYEKGKGLPIGNMTSQILAIMYLDELDKYIKENLNIKYYIRYMDDGIIIHNDKEYLKYCLSEINKIITKYKLNLNNKTKIYKCNDEIDFLGFRFVLKNNKIIMKVRNDTKRRFKRKIKMYKDKEKYIEIKNSYLNHFSYGDCNNLIEKYISYNCLNVFKVNIINNEIVKTLEKIIF